MQPSRAELQLEQLAEVWVHEPVRFVLDVLGAKPEPWQCDVLDALVAEDNVAVRACHGVGKTALLSWAILWFTCTRPFSKVPTTAPTFNKQVRDVLWSEVHKWYRTSAKTLPLLPEWFAIVQTRLQHVDYPTEWFAVGIASTDAVNIEGYHAKHLLAVFDEAKGIPKATWDAVHGMRTTQEAKLLVASTPGGPGGEYHRVFTRYRQTWPSLFVVHPEALRAVLARPEAPPRSLGGTYYSPRVRKEWVEERAQEWGPDSPVYVARVVGDFPAVEDDQLIPYPWLSEAEDRKEGAAGPRWVACDVARYGRDRTVFLVGEGGTLLYGETIARTPADSTAPEVRVVGVGEDPKRPRYRGVDVTAEVCQRLRREYKGVGIVIDDSGVGGGVSDLLRRCGEPVKPLNFGTAPTNKPRDPDVRASRERRNLVDTPFVNLKAEMGWHLRAAFESGAIALGRLKRPIADPLIAQASTMRYEFDAAGRLRLVDPDDQEIEAIPVGGSEGRRSPDHFHALLLLWWMTGTRHALTPMAGPVLPKGIHILGPPPSGGIPAPVGRAIRGGPASSVRGWYEPWWR